MDGHWGAARTTAEMYWLAVVAQEAGLNDRFAHLDTAAPDSIRSFLSSLAPITTGI